MPSNNQDVNADHVASHLGKATGIVTLLQSTPSQIKKRQFSLPSQFMANHSISTEQVYKDPGCLRDIVFDVASEANSQMQTARGMALPDGAWLALLGSSLPTRFYLETLEKVNFDLFDSRLTTHSWRVFPSIYKSYTSRKI
jgi:NADH dehydrogenase [ubiquinone] 1 alpha subcomplex assembly factor 6